MAVANVDAEKLRLDETIRRGIEPRIDFAIHTVEIGSGRIVFIIRVRESWILPHRVVYQGKFGEFWARNSAGKYSMDTTELRRAFNLSESIYEKVRSFRRERVDQILQGNGPLLLKEGPKLILHLIPLESFRSRSSLNFDHVEWYTTNFPPIGNRQTVGWGPRLNFDGLLISWQSEKPVSLTTYVQIYRNGMIEAALDSISRPIDGTNHLSTKFYERELVNNMSLYLKGLKSLSIRPPIFAFLTLTGVKGALIYQGAFSSVSDHLIDRDVLSVPEIVIEDLDQSVTELFRPAFNLIWNAAGLPKSDHFDEQGNLH